MSARMLPPSVVGELEGVKADDPLPSYSLRPFYAARSFLGTSGQPLDDIFKYLEGEDRLGMAERTLEWGHISPTCPDTLCKLK